MCGIILLPCYVKCILAAVTELGSYPAVLVAMIMT